MPARKRTLLGDTPEEQRSPLQALPDPDRLSDQVERILGELGEGADSVAVYREDDARPGKFNFLARVPAAEFSTDYVASQYGGGEYKIVIIDRTQGPLEPVMFSVDRRLVGKAFAVTQSQNGRDGEQGFKDRLLEMMLQRVLLQPAPAPVAAPSSQRDPLDYLIALAPLLKSDGGSNIESLVTMMTAMIDLSSKMQPAEGMAAVAGQLLPVVDKLITAQASQGLARRLPVSTAPRSLPPIQTIPEAGTLPLVQPASPTPEPTTTTTAPVIGTIVPQWLAPFKLFAPMLVNLADTEADPALYADVCVDQLSNNESAFRSAVEAMNAGTLKDDVLSAVPALQETPQRQEFVTQLVLRVEEGLREILSQETEEANG